MAEEFVDARKPSAKPNPTRVILLSIILVVLVLVLLIVIYLRKGKEVTEITPTTTVTASATTVASTTPAIDRVIDEGVTWVKPVKLDDLDLIEKINDDSTDSNYIGTEYFKVATLTDGGEIILAKVNYEYKGPSLDNLEYMRFIKRNGEYKLISKNKTGSYERPGYRVKVTEYSDSFVLASLIPDQKITSGATQLIQKSGAGLTKDFDGTSLGKKVSETRWGSLYVSNGTEIANSEGAVDYAYYYIALNDGTKVVFEPLPSFIRDDGTLSITTSIDKLKDAKFSRMVTGGCGGANGSFPLVSSQTSIAGKKEVGKSSSGSKIYSLDDKDNSVVKFSYNTYSANGNVEGAKSIDDYIANYGIILWTDDFGSTQIYMNQDYLPMVECAKPVVYLYPTKETPVEVKVGANVTVSEPTYGQGWSGVAKPNGQVVVNGKAYPNLFWEGLGWGIYPQVKSGTVVKTAEAEATITSQLKAMSLNDQEIADFLEFWLPKMPKTEYVRISWIYGEDMEKLAPLYINPKPETVIRVFMDFAGLDVPVNIAKQELPSFERKGFTAVEWGGLLVK